MKVMPFSMLSLHWLPPPRSLIFVRKNTHMKQRLHSSSPFQYLPAIPLYTERILQWAKKIVHYNCGELQWAHSCIFVVGVSNVCHYSWNWLLHVDNNMCETFPDDWHLAYHLCNTVEEPNLVNYIDRNFCVICLMIGILSLYYSYFWEYSQSEPLFCVY